MLNEQDLNIIIKIMRDTASRVKADMQDQIDVHLTYHKQLSERIEKIENKTSEASSEK